MDCRRVRTRSTRLAAGVGWSRREVSPVGSAVAEQQRDHVALFRVLLLPLQPRAHGQQFVDGDRVRSSAGSDHSGTGPARTVHPALGDEHPIIAWVIDFAIDHDGWGSAGSQSLYSSTTSWPP